MLKIGLVHSPNKDFSDNQNYGLKFSPVWAYLLASYISQNNSSSVLFDLNNADLDSVTECDVFFYSGINQDLDAILEARRYIGVRFPKKKHFIGGPIAWSFDKAGELSKLSEFDHICIGDGEILVPQILNGLRNSFGLEKIIRIEDRFDLKKSLPMDSTLINATADHYYGAVIEVSRGCPFLCEFCDIRVMPDNNRNHCKSVETIIYELDLYRAKGISNIQLACDNFIGDLEWAKSLVSAIIEYNRKYNWSPSFYTWLTINIASYDTLMKDMRIAGFDNLFIGIESFNNNSLLETSKLQNTKVTIVNTIRKIQSYGFIVVGGLIFGFDSDEGDCFQMTLDGIAESGMLSGDASLLTALPGTPLYRRMKLSNRLREFKHDSLLGGHKYVTNIKYLLDSTLLVNGYIKFSKTFMDGRYQYLRLANFYELISTSDLLINVKRAGYTDINAFMKKIYKSPKLFIFHIKRMAPLIFSDRIFYLISAIFIALKYKLIKKIGFQYFIFWLFIWVNAINKYGSLKSEDFDIASIGEDFNFNDIIPEGYRELADERIPKNKINAQFKATTSQLKKVIEIKLLKSNNI